MESPIITRDILKDFREDFAAHVEQLENEYGFKLTIGNISFDGKTAVAKLNIATVGDNGEVFTKEAQDFTHYAGQFGINKDLLNSSFDHRGDTFKIVGLKPRSKRAPILCEREDGKMFKFPVFAVQHATGTLPK
jgi:hypothetical protein